MKWKIQRPITRLKAASYYLKNRMYVAKEEELITYHTHTHIYIYIYIYQENLKDLKIRHKIVAIDNKKA